MPYEIAERKYKTYSFAGFSIATILKCDLNWLSDGLN